MKLSGLRQASLDLGQLAQKMPKTYFLQQRFALLDTPDMYNLTPRQLAWRVAQDIPAMTTLALGAGTSAAVADYLVPAHKIVVCNASSHSDIYVLDATQVAQNGDVIGHDAPSLSIAETTRVLAIMKYFADDGSCAIVPACTRPISAKRCVRTIYTDLAILDLSDGKVFVRELVEGITLYSLQAETPVELYTSPQLRLLQAPKLT
jgi:acyl CoA:acetate/3-ketoacid CoA transferase beta subunit